MVILRGSQSRGGQSRTKFSDCFRLAKTPLLYDRDADVHHTETWMVTREKGKVMWEEMVNLNSV